MIAAMISDIDCAFSNPFNPNNRFMIRIEGIRERPDLKAAKNVAVFVRPIDWNSIFPYIVIGINTNEMEYHFKVTSPIAITSGSSLNIVTRLLALK